MLSPAAVKLEQGFPELYPVNKAGLNKEDIKEVSFDFEGTGFILAGQSLKKEKSAPEYVIEAEMYIDGKKIETAKFPTSFTTRRHELFWRYELPNGKHTVLIRVLNPNPQYALNGYSYIVYSDKPVGSLQIK